MKQLIEETRFGHKASLMTLQFWPGAVVMMLIAAMTLDLLPPQTQ